MADANGAEPDCPPWYEEAFGEHYLDLYGHRDEAAAERETGFAMTALGQQWGLLLRKNEENRLRAGQEFSAK